ncbi:MAG: PH domain-containing protein [Haloferacaceae archaeon]
MSTSGGSAGATDGPADDPAGGSEGSTSVPDEAASATAPPEWLSLDDDEEVIWVGEPAFATLYGTIVTGLVLVVVLIGILILLGVPFSYLRITNTDYVVTTKSLYVRRGVLSTNIETVDLDRIQNTEFQQSFWGKQFGYGKILVSTAGSGGAEITFDGISDATTVRERIDQLRARRVSRGDDGVSGPSASGGAGGTPASEAQLAELIQEVRATREAFERIEDHLLSGVTRDPDGDDAGSDATDSDDDEDEPADTTADDRADRTP